MSDLLLRQGLIAGRRQDVAIRDGRIHRIRATLDAAGSETLDVTDRLVLPGFVESHIHPDKAFIADRTEGLRPGGRTAQTLVAALKKTFTVDDIYGRARRALELAVRHGCTAMRAHVEVDAYVELRGVEALRRLQAELAGVLDLQLIAFAQDARDPAQAITEQAEKLFVIKGGRIVARNTRTSELESAPRPFPAGAARSGRT